MTDPFLIPLVRAAARTYAPGTMPWFHNRAGTCQVYKSVVLGHPAYTFGATRTFREWMVDFLALDVPTFAHSTAGPIHLGFWLDTIDAIDAINADLAALGRPSFLLGGHSKGAAEAVIAHLELKARGHAPLATRCYEPPMVGTRLLTDYLAGDDLAWTQTHNRAGDDIVTLVPDWPEWEHQGPCARLLVPNGDGIAEKHGIAAVLAGVLDSA